MGFFRGHKRRGAFDLFSSYEHYAPGFDGIIMMLILFIGGAFLGSFFIELFSKVYGGDAALEYGNLISYPLCFIPAMLYASVNSRLRDHGTRGIKLDDNNFKPHGGFKLSMVAIVATIATAFVIEPVNLLLPPMSPEFELQMKLMMEIMPLWVAFISLSILAPFFEEWMCRGIILRGLLKRYHPAVAIASSAAFFGLIHMNIWQGVPAFFMGLVFGYVYYKTGSLKLTMLMHCANNTIALALGQIPQLKEATSMMDVMSPLGYAAAYIAFAVALAAAFVIFRSIQPREGLK